MRLSLILLSKDVKFEECNYFLSTNIFKAMLNDDYLKSIHGQKGGLSRMFFALSSKFSK